MGKMTLVNIKYTSVKCVAVSNPTLANYILNQERFHRLDREKFFIHSDGPPSLADLEVRKIGDSRDNVVQCDHRGPQLSPCVTCRTLICYERYVKVDVTRPGIETVSSDLKNETDSWFKEQLDMKSLKTLATLKLELDTFSIKELRELYRKSRVAIDANFTNNRHVHEEILKEIESCRVVKKREKRLECVAVSRKMSVENYRKTLQEFREAHEKLVDVTRMKLEAEEQHISLLGKLESAKVVHDEMFALHCREIKPNERRARKNSM